MIRSIPRIELLFAPGCAAIQGTIAMVDEVLGELRMNAEIARVMVENEEKVRALRFLGSPSIRVNGHDIEPGADQRQDYSMG
ncbi:MAG: hypothetical protein JRI89_10165 [Deltaproteobacteria bacterium]|nr:hypothetical protein [Deltaproteobacteria bacterium]